MSKHRRPETTLREFLSSFLRHKGKMALAFAIVMAVTVAATVTAAKHYKSEAKLFVRLGRESVTLDPTATTGQTVLVQELRELEMNSVFELLRSRVIMEETVDAVGAEVILAGKYPDPVAQGEAPKAGLLASMRTLNPFGPYSERDEAIKRLFAQLDVYAVKKSSVIAIAYDAASPDLARDVVTKVIEIARDSHMRVNRTAGSLDFFSDQTERLREKLAGSERELRDLKNATGLASLEQQREIQLKRAGQIEEDSLKAQAELAAVRAEIDARRKKLAVLPETIVTSEATGMANSARDVMREQLYALQLKEKSLLSQYQEDTFFIKSIRAEVAAAQAELDREPRLPHVTTGRNEAHQDMHRALLDQESLAESLAAKVQSLQVQLVEAQGNLKHLNDNEVRIAELTRRIDLETHNYRKYSENLEQARIDRALQDESISNLNILQPPTFSITPTRPRKLLNLALGLVVAVCASLATAVLAELLKPPAELNALDSTDSDPRALTSRLSGKHFAERVAINGS